MYAIATNAFTYSSMRKLSTGELPLTNITKVMTNIIVKELTKLDIVLDARSLSAMLRERDACPPKSADYEYR